MNEYTCTGCQRTFRKAGSSQTVRCGWCGHDAITLEERKRRAEREPLQPSAPPSELYVGVADAIRGAGPRAGRRMIVEAIADHFASTNPHFNHTAFRRLALDDGEVPLTESRSALYAGRAMPGHGSEPDGHGSASHGSTSGHGSEPRSEPKP